MSLDVVPIWAAFVGALVGILLSEELGYRFGRWRRTRREPEQEAPVGGIVAAELGLLAFMLAFVFGVAASRFDERRKLMIDEANAIGTTYLRAGLLPSPHRETARQILRDYLNVRLNAIHSQILGDTLQQSQKLQDQLWAEASAVIAKEPQAHAAALFVQTTNDVIDIHAKRVNALFWSRLPFTVWLVLALIAGLSFASLGYQTGLSGKPRSPAVLGMALTFSAVLWMVIDLERPLEGMLRVSPQPLIELRQTMQP